MEPLQSQNYNQPSNRNTPTAKKRILIWIPIAISVVVLIGVGLLLWWLFGNKPPETARNNQPAQEAYGQYKQGTEQTAVNYAGNKVYDACNMIQLSTIEKYTSSYKAAIESIGKDEIPIKPLKIEHFYYDRDTPTPLGKDGETRQKGTQIGGSADSIVNYLSAFDSKCYYGQGNDLYLGLGGAFAITHVIQRPAVASAELKAYIDSVAVTYEEDGLTIHVEPTTSNGFVNIILTNASKDTIVVVQTAGSVPDLSGYAAEDAIKALAKEPTGAFALTYPTPWETMPNPCKLLTANDFQQFIGKPATALASDFLTLTEIGGRQMERSCQRLEVERLDGSGISEASVTVRLSTSENAAKDYVEHVKTNKADLVEVREANNVSGADETSLLVEMQGNKEGSYTIQMRIGSAILLVSSKGESGKDVSAEAFVERVRPMAESVVKRFKQLQ